MSAAGLRIARGGAAPRQTGAAEKTTAAARRGALPADMDGAGGCRLEARVPAVCVQTQ